ncbi:MAG: HNH endonuclease [Desulfovibrio sp.]|nr:HNH endonuclease [Desulfovibrio sp.]
MLKLLASVSPSRFARKKGDLDREAEAAFARKRPMILKRDNFTCQGCGVCFVSKDPQKASGLEVHHINANPQDNREDNLVCLCTLCHGIFHIGCFARRLGTGMRVIHCPELDQGHLNLLSWTMALTFFKTRQSQDAEAYLLQKKARHLRTQLILREDFPQSYFRDDEALATFHAKIRHAKTIAYLGTLLGMLRAHYPEAYNQRASLLGGLRVFYDPEATNLYQNRQGQNLLAILDQASQWESGSAWSKTWAILGKTLS